jgi:hypothetical protein
MNGPEILFAQIVQIFLQAGMQGLGKIKNPVTDKIEISLDQAKNSIDILSMLKTKTKGNLSKEEEQFLEMALNQLKLNYVDEANKK